MQLMYIFICIITHEGQHFTFCCQCGVVQKCMIYMVLKNKWIVHCMSKQCRIKQKLKRKEALKCDNWEYIKFEIFISHIINGQIINGFIFKYFLFRSTKIYRKKHVVRGKSVNSNKTIWIKAHFEYWQWDIILRESR